MYPWEKRLGKPKDPRRYMLASATFQEEATFPAVPGCCTWCGKPIPRKNQRFCPGVWEEVGYPLRNLYPAGKRRVYHCYDAFAGYWLTIPRFKRVVFLRDEFTCQACGARPTFVNAHGLELPDLNQLACDHIIPVARGGETVLGNLQTLCRKCNAEKGDKLDWQPAATVSFDEFLELNINQRVAARSGFRLTWRRVNGGLVMGMGAK